MTTSDEYIGYGINKEPEEMVLFQNAGWTDLQNK
jgi:hypothetical protein